MNATVRRVAPWAFAFVVGTLALQAHAERIDVGINRVMPCESQHGVRNFCSANTDGGVKLLRSYGDIPCKRGRSWDYDHRGVWVSDGCRGDFEVRRGEAARSDPPPVESLPRQRPDDRRGDRHDGDLVVCESRGRKRNFCRVDTRGSVRLQRQLSHRGCVYGNTWGYDDRGIWVDGGCRGEFRIDRRRRHDDYYHHDHRHDGRRGDYGRSRVIRCESHRHEEVRCQADTRGGVELIEQLSRKDCRRGHTWGEDHRGIWVRDGCRAEFRVGGRRY